MVSVSHNPISGAVTFHFSEAVVAGYEATADTLTVNGDAAAFATPMLSADQLVTNSAAPGDPWVCEGGAESAFSGLVLAAGSGVIVPE